MRRNDIKNEARETCSWLLKNEDYKTWIQDQGLLWIKGKPGAGKSTLLKYALRQAENQASPKKPLVASFFFHGRGADIQKTPLGLYRSLLHQILDQIPNSLPELISTFKKNCETQGMPGEKWNWNEMQLQDFLKDAILRVSKTHSMRIYVDALDECGEKVAKGLVEFFEVLISDLPTGATLSICFSCRHYPIVTLNHGRTISVEENNGPDISSYVQLKLQLFEPKSEAQELEKTIVSMTSGVFQWVVLVVPIVLSLYERGKNMKTIRKELKELPRELGSLYQNILRNIVKKDRSQSLLLMQWICFAQKPLSLVELRYAMVLGTDVLYSSVEQCKDSDDYAESDETMERQVKSLSCGLAEVKEFDDKRIAQFIHQSVNDYLLQSGLQELGSPSSSSVTGHAHLRLSRACIKYIAMEEVSSCWSENQRCENEWRAFASSVLSYESRQYEREICELVEYKILKRSEIHRDFPFLRYALGNSFLHANKAEAERISEADAADLACLLQGRSDQILSTWTKLYQVITRPSFPKPHRNMNLLHVASMYGLPSVLLAALKSQNDIGIDSEDAIGWTPLLWAAFKGHEAVVRLLLKRVETGQVDVDSKDNTGRTPLGYAVMYRHKAVVQLLLETGRVDVNLKTPYPHNTSNWALNSALNGVYPKNIFTRDAVKDLTPLYVAVMIKDEAIVRLLLETGKVDVTSRQEALELAVSDGLEDIVRVFETQA